MDDLSRPGLLQQEDPEMTRLYRVIERILDIGFFIGVGVILVGVIVTFANGDELPNDVTHLADLPHAVADFQASAVIDLGLVLLLLTPLSYVIAALVTFIRHGDRMFIGICLLLICLIGLSAGLAFF
jgi:uncharacterized membrane protein